MALVKNSLTLDNIIIHVKNNKRHIWLVTRSGTIKKIFIKSKLGNHNFVRNHNFVVDVDNININKQYTEEWFEVKVKGKNVGGSGRFYDYYYSAGHFFDNQSDAFIYLLLRIEANPKNLVKSATNLIDKYPEYVI